MNALYEAWDAAKTVKDRGDLVDTVTMKAWQLESLFAALACAAELPEHHRENLCMLGCDLATDIRKACDGS